MGRNKKTARRDFVHKQIQAHVDLICEQRSATMTFEFHLPFGPVNTAVNTLLDPDIEVSTHAHCDQALIL